MTEARNAETEESPYVRAPWPLVAASLLGILVLALGLGLFANRYLRPAGGAAPPPVARSGGPAVSAVADSPTATIAGPTNPSLAPTSTIQRGASTAATATGIPATPTVPVPTPLATQAVSLVSTESPTAPAQPVATTTASVRQTISPGLASELGDAYQHYWEIRAEALLHLDTSRLSEVMAEDHLLAIEKLVEQLRQEGRAIRTNVDHQYAVLSASEETAEIADTYSDTSVYVDAGSHEVVSQPSNDVLREQYTMKKIDGVWKVTSLVRAE